VNTEFDSADKLVATADRYIQIGYWEWFALQQHGTVRLSIDATSQQVAKKNVTAVTINTAWSMTDLSVYINGANNVSQAFGLYKVVEPEPTTV
jgi:phosphoserine aminotransferase